MPGPFDRFRNLERPRPEREGEAEPEPTPDGVAERFGQPDMPPDASDAAPVRCPKCGGENPVRAAACFNCGAELDTPEVRAHRVEEKARFAAEQRRASAQREARRREAEAYAERELARHKAQLEQKSAPTSDVDSGQSNVPVAWLWRATGQVSDPWIRLVLQLAIIGGVGALVLYGISSPGRYGLLILVGILLGGGSYVGGYYGYGRYGRYRRWWW
ncbi:MAG TPA: zinc ribbon domain-containing protein [Myxococcota bacterium]|nr:zinc ribbon domain-containing protein [Myxococcota bacterium]